jgi:predicted ATPase/class 3 adenylate cyclase
MLFTDIEASTRLASELGPGWAEVLSDHRALVADAIATEGGYVDGTEGDAFFATFADASAAARAAVRLLRALRDHAWPSAMGELKVRMGLHVGFVERTDAGYLGLEVHRAARVAAAAHGGQLLMTTAAQSLIGDQVAVESVGVHRLKDFPVPAQLFCAVIDGRGAASFPPPRAPEVRPTNLPAVATVLLGRDEDLRRVREALLVEGERLVTLTGRGGAGKTSLALVAAAALLDEHPGGVWLVRLANVTDPARVLAAVATSTGAQLDVDAPPLQELTSRFGERGATLFVLDNMEHLLPAAPTLAELLEALPGLRLLVTSQAPLRVAAERCLPLDALDDDAGLALIERVAERRAPELAIKAADREALLEVVHLLDGLPLALELAAARLVLMTPSELLERLRASPDVLRDDRVDRPERHRSLRATVGWTLGLLDGRARDLFERLGVFAGPVELDEIEAVASADGLDILDQLATLIDVAVVRRVELGDGRVRFGLPEALRQIAAARLDDAPYGALWRHAHARRQLEIVWAARALFVPTPVYEAALRADPEIASAIRWASTAGDASAAAMAAARGALLADTGNLREAFAMLEPLVGSPLDDPDVFGQALWAYSWGLAAAGRNDEALPVADRAVTVARGDHNRAMALMSRSLVHGFRGELREGVNDAAEAVAIARRLEPSMLCGTLQMEAQARQFAGELTIAAALQAEAERVGRPVDCHFLWRRHTIYADHAMLSGRPLEALSEYALSLEAAQVHGNEIQVLFDLVGVANALAAARDDQASVEVAAMAEQQMTELGGRTASDLEPLGYREIAEARDRLGPDQVEESEARGRSVAAAGRVGRACELARARQLA